MVIASVFAVLFICKASRFPEWFVPSLQSLFLASSAIPQQSRSFTVESRSFHEVVMTMVFHPWRIWWTGHCLLSMFFFLDVCLLMYREWGRWDLREFPTSISLFLFYSSFSEKKSQYVRILLEMEIFSSFDEIFSLWLRNQFGKSQESVWKLENWKEFNIILFVTYFFFKKILKIYFVFQYWVFFFIFWVEELQRKLRIWCALEGITVIFVFNACKIWIEVWSAETDF